MGLTVRADFNKKYEMVLDTRVSYIKLDASNVKRVGYVLQCSWNQFRRQLSNRELPKSDYVYYCRDGLDGETQEIYSLSRGGRPVSREEGRPASHGGGRPASRAGKGTGQGPARPPSHGKGSKKPGSRV